MNRPPDFIANLQYITTERSGRKTPLLSGYFPQIKFSFSEVQTGGRQKFVNKEIVNPGDEVIAEITMFCPELFKSMLKVGFRFEVREGSKIVGAGIILEIHNRELLSE